MTCVTAVFLLLLKSIIRKNSRVGVPADLTWARRPTLLVFVLLLFSFQSASAAERQIQITNGAATPGNQTTLYLRMDQVSAFAGGDFEIAYNPSWISIVDVLRSTNTNSFFLVRGNPAAGRLTISLASAEGLPPASNADLALINVLVNQQVSPDTLIPMTFISARWYDENSVRGDFLADNAVVLAGASVPTEEPLALELGSCQTTPGGQAEMLLTLFLAEGASTAGTTLNYNPSLLSNPRLALGSAVSGWQESHSVSNGSLTLLIKGTSNLSGVAPVTLLSCAFDVASSAVPGVDIPVTLTQSKVSNSAGLGFYVTSSNGKVTVLTPTPTSTPTPSPSSLADFNSDGKVNKADIFEFLSTWHKEGDAQ